MKDIRWDWNIAQLFVDNVCDFQVGRHCWWLHVFTKKYTKILKLNDITQYSTNTAQIRYCEAWQFEQSMTAIAATWRSWTDYLLSIVVCRPTHPFIPRLRLKKQWQLWFIPYVDKHMGDRKIVKSLDDTCPTWALLRWSSLMDRHYIRHLELYLFVCLRLRDLTFNIWQNRLQSVDCISILPSGIMDLGACDMDMSRATWPESGR